MSIIVFVLLTFFVIFLFANSGSSKKTFASNSEKMATLEFPVLPDRLCADYKYIKTYGARFGYSEDIQSQSHKILYFMTEEQIKGAAIYIREELKRENEVKLKERQQKFEEDKKRKEELYAESLRVEEEKKSKMREVRFSNISKNFLYEISSSSPKNDSGVYIILCTKTNEVYVGSSIGIVKRKATHISSLRKGSHHSYRLQQAYDKYGEESLKFYAYRIITIDNAHRYFYNKDGGELSEEDKLENFKRALKGEEQSCILSIYPEFNIEKDSRGERHWRGNSRYSRY